MTFQKKHGIALALLFLVTLATAYAYRIATPVDDLSTPTTGRYMDIESYVRSSISALSPIKEQLGGTYYVTEIKTDGGSGTVTYEDGHNEYTADFTYTIDENGKPAVETFVVRTLYDESR